VIDNSLEREEGKDLSPEGLGDLLDRVFSGRLSNPVPLPVLPAYQDILGERIWVCPDGVEKDQTSDLSFTADELRLILPRLKQDRSLARIVLEAKKIFGGTIMGFPNRMPDEEMP
jgi:hypothetical protein